MFIVINLLIFFFFFPTCFQDHGYIQRNEKSDAGNLNLEDYSPNDPVPSSKASIQPGPIQHGTPLMPYIQKPSPPAPDHPKNAEFP